MTLLIRRVPWTAPVRAIASCSRVQTIDTPLRAINISFLDIFISELQCGCFSYVVLVVITFMVETGQKTGDKMI